MVKLMNIGKKHRRKEERFRLPLSAYLYYLVIATFLFTGVTLSSYVSTVSGSDSASVAIFDVRVTGGDQALTLDSSHTTASYGFSVTSNSEVTVGYDVVVTLSKALPEGVSMTLKKDDSDMGAASVNENQYTWTNAEPFAAGADTTHTYTLTFIAGTGAKTGSVEQIQVTVNARQED